MVIFLFAFIEYRNKNFRRKVKEIEDDFLRIFVNRESEQQPNNVEKTKKINGKFLVGWLNKLFINFPFCSIQ